MKPTKANLIKTAKAAGVTPDGIDETHGLSPAGFDMSFHLPKGWCWNCDGEGIHVIVVSQWGDESRADCIADGIDRMAMGSTACHCDECVTAEGLPVVVRVYPYEGYWIAQAGTVNGLFETHEGREADMRAKAEELARKYNVKITTD